MRYYYNISRSAVLKFEQVNCSERRRKKHQIELADKKQEENVALYSGAAGNRDSLGVAQKKLIKEFRSYDNSSQFPPPVEDLAVAVDVKASTVLVPIMGRLVPFHIETIRNTNTSRLACGEEGESALLRINFFVSGDKGWKGDQQSKDASPHILRYLTFKSKDVDRMKDLARQITELRRIFIEQERKDAKSLVKDENLVKTPNGNSHRLRKVFARPSVVLEGKKRMPGEVEIHKNGLRYCDPRGGNIDVLFRNVKHLFFQPIGQERLVIIHIHLKYPILIGKKEAKDVQFYREVTDTLLEEKINRKRMYSRFLWDDDELEPEQKRQRQRDIIEKSWKAFAEKIQAAGRGYIEGVDVPFRKLGFYGVPDRSNVLCLPTAGCLVQLHEPPFMVITLEEVEVVYLERVQFGVNNFDMVCVFKDFHRTPLHIRHISIENLESVKGWLDLVNIVFYQGQGSVDWARIMKTVVEDIWTFFKDGGWSCLSLELDDDDDDKDEDETSTFEMTPTDWKETSSESSFEETSSESLFEG